LSRNNILQEGRKIRKVISKLGAKCIFLSIKEDETKRIRITSGKK